MNPEPAIRQHRALAEIDAAAWNALVSPAGEPFLRHELLAAMEETGAVGEDYGWIPAHLTVWRGDTLVGACPYYLKDNSYGEFVFDWAWADAWERMGRRYYPKGVSAIPYTPAPGPRLLIAPHESEPDAIRHALLEALRGPVDREEISGTHLLFTDAEDTAAAEAAGFLTRWGVQFHWHNRGWADFDAFLADFTSKRRKEVRRERRQVSDAGLTLETRHGDELTEADWEALIHFYRDPFLRKGGIPTFSREYFRRVGERLPRNLVVFLARDGDQPVAAAICYRGGDTLYGRHWGAAADYPGLHFEACYYQGIEYCLREGLARFEPGAQGEYKVPRGFEPVWTRSVHLLGWERLQPAVADFIQRERGLLEDYVADLQGQLPFREDGGREGGA
jgi:hypothetical protein